MAIIYLFIYCQTDSLLSLLSPLNPNSSSEQVDRYLKISKELWQYDRRLSDSILMLIDQKITFTNKSTSWGRVELMKANRLKFSPQKTNAYLTLDSICEVEQLPSEIRVTIKQRLIKQLLKSKKRQEAITEYKKAIGLAEHSNSQKLGALLFGISGQLIKEESYFEAMDYLVRALEVPGMHQGKAYAALPNVCRKIEDWKSLISYSKEGLKRASKEENRKGEIFGYMQLGYAYMQMDSFEIAKEYSSKALDICFTRRISSKLPMILSTLIQIELKKGNVKAALDYEPLLDSIPKRKRVTSALTQLAKAYLLDVQIPKAIDYAKRALENIDPNREQAYDVALVRMESNKTLAEAYALLEDYSRAYEALSNYSITRQEIENKASFINISRALNKKDLAQQEKILQLERIQSESILKEKIKRLRLAGALVFFILLLGLLAYGQLRKRNLKIKEQKKVISKALGEKDVLLREIHHRVKNNLQLISSLLTLQGRSIDDEMAIQAINDGRSRVRSMALIHQDLYNKENLTGINVKPYLEKLCSELFTTYKVDQNQVQLNLDIEEMELDVDTLVPLGLIINELITNSLKYAFVDQENALLSISLKYEDESLLLEVRNNGSGYDLEKVESGSFGSTLVSALTEQLEGTLKRETKNGTSVIIRFNQSEGLN